MNTMTGVPETQKGFLAYIRCVSIMLNTVAQIADKVIPHSLPYPIKGPYLNPWDSFPRHPVTPY